MTYDLFKYNNLKSSEMQVFNRLGVVIPFYETLGGRRLI